MCANKIKLYSFLHQRQNGLFALRLTLLIVENGRKATEVIKVHFRVIEVSSKKHMRKCYFFRAIQVMQ